jgi:type VI secretion system secreted protein VgrG
VHKGSLDGQGFASVAGLPIGTAKVVFGKDPRDPWDEASHFPESEMWPAKAIGDSVASGSTGGTAGGAGGVGEARVWQGAPALRSATAAAANGLGSLGNAAVALGQAGQAAGMARQAAGAVQAVKQGGAKAVLGQPGQIVGMAAGAASGIVGVAGLSGAVGGFAGPTVPSMAKLPGALPSAGADRVAGGMRTLPGQTPGFAG